MPVFRFRDPDSARDALAAETDPAAALKRAAWIWAFSARLSPLRRRPGLHRFKSVEEAQAARETDEGERP